MTDEKAWRDLVGKLLAWEDAHVGFEAAVAGIPPKLRGVRSSRRPAFALGDRRASAARAVRHPRLLHQRRTTRKRSGQTTTGRRPPRPRQSAAWDASIAQSLRDRQALQKLAANPKIKLTARIPHGSGQTYLRELVLVADHAAYHVGQLVLVRQLLGIWKAKRG